MRKNTHMLGGIAFALLLETTCLDSNIDIISFKNISNLALYYSSSVLGSVFPDIDKEGTYISNRVPYIAKFINKMFGHRTITHSLTLLFLLFLLFNYLELNIFISTGFLVGYLSHIILDMFNRKGVQLFYPFKYRVRFMKITTGTTSENLFKYLLISLVFILIISR